MSEVKLIFSRLNLLFGEDDMKVVNALAVEKDIRNNAPYDHPYYLVQRVIHKRFLFWEWIKEYNPGSKRIEGPCSSLKALDDMLIYAEKWSELDVHFVSLKQMYKENPRLPYKTCIRELNSEELDQLHCLIRLERK